MDLVEDWSHRYTRVTEVLSILNTYKDVPQAILDAAAERGTQVHDAISGILPLDQVNDLHMGYIGAHQQWESVAQPQYLHRELRLFDHGLMLTGALDAIASIQGKITLVDYKTSSKFMEKSYSLQMNAYVRLAAKNKIYIENVILLMLSKDGRYKAHTVEISDDSWATFLSLLTQFRMRGSNAQT